MSLLNTLDEVYIKDLMVQIVRHALSINPLQSAWLKTYAEIQYGELNIYLNITSTHVCV